MSIAFYGALLRQSFADAEIDGFWFVVVMVGILAFIALMAYNTASQRRRRRAPILTASSEGLSQKARDKNISISWGEMRAWAIVSAPNHLQARRTCVVSSEHATITWTEGNDAQLAGRGIQGDRRLAYQERAKQLHHLIEARTGLPLREITNQPL
jgi:hypothetical protein